MKFALVDMRWMAPEFPPVDLPHSQEKSKRIHGTATEPGARLALAVLEQAILDIQKMPKSKKIHYRHYKEGQHALDWVFTEYETRGLSFAYVCEVLDLDPSALRKRITNDVQRMTMPSRGAGRYPVTSKNRFYKKRSH